MDPVYNPPASVDKPLSEYRQLKYGVMWVSGFKRYEHLPFISGIPVRD